MKLIHISAAAITVSMLPGLLCSCVSGQKEPQPVEVKEDANNNQNADIYFAPQDVKKTEAAPAEVKETQPAPAEVKETQPAPAEQKKSEAVPAEKAEKSAKTVPPCDHTVRTGDNLWKISRQYYGSGAKWKIIFDANRSKLKKAEFLEPGTVLTIPADK